MSLIHIESFDMYGTTPVLAALQERYVNVNVNANHAGFVPGRNGGLGLQMGGGSFGFNGLAGNATWVFGFAFQDLSATTRTEATILHIRDGTVDQVVLNYNPSTGRFSVRLGKDNSSVGTGSAIIAKGFWYYVEFKVVVNGSTGSVYLRVNTVQDIGVASIDTAATGNNSANSFVFDFFGGTFMVDDLYVLNGSGSINNDFLGDMKVEAVVPVSNGDSIQWSSSSGAPNYLQVSDIPADGDGSYVYSNTLNAVDIYNFGTLSKVTSNVRAVMVNLLARRSDSNFHTVATAIKSAGTTYVGTTQTIPDTAYDYVSQLYEQDPATTTLWTISGVQNAQYGMKLIS